MSRTVRLEGLPDDVNTRDLRLHFAGLEIPQGGVTIIGGQRGVAYLDFITRADARSALRLSGDRINNSTIYIYPSSIAETERSLKNYQTRFPSRRSFHEDGKQQEGRDSLSPGTHLYLRFTAGPAVGSKKFVRRCFEGLNVVDLMNTSDSPAIRHGDALVRFSNSTDAYEAKRRFRDDKDITMIWSSEREWAKCCMMRSEKSPKFAKALENPIFDGDFHVCLTNVNHATTKEDLKKLFFHLVSENDIMILCDEKGQRTKVWIVMFKRREDYERVLKLNNVTCNGSPLFISAISKSRLRYLLKSRKVPCLHYLKTGNCLYLRNFPSSVSKRDIQEFFAGFSLNREDISLLCDKDGVGLGEVVVTFSSEEGTDKAQKLHRKKFQDKRIRMKRISEERLQDFLCAKSVSLMADPYDCVTQEDDDDSPDEEKTDDNMPDEDSGFHQMDNTHVYVTQEDDDDEPDTPAGHVDEAPSTSSVF
ncbi:RNA-binding protein 12B-B-like isoform X2 [Eleutherodactylus coqui]